MSTPGPREVEHSIEVDAPPSEIYRLIAEVENWPQIFPPTIYADHLERSDTEEVIRIWATANGQAKSWSSRRNLEPGRLRVTFRQQVSAPPVAEMSGQWIIEERVAGRSRVRLLHSYRSVDDDPDGLAWIDRAVDRNSRSELAALKTNVERYLASRELTFSFEDTVRIEGSAKDAYDFVNEAGLWSERLPHVATVRLSEDVPGLQTLEMDTRAKDGSTHTTKSYRVCLPHERIAYKQTTLPALLDLHTGCWTFRETEDGTFASSQHTVALNPGRVQEILGPDAGVEDARTYVHTALSTNSKATLGHAKAYAEKRR
jgi:aromatase